uniref:Uncharacterized protein n=1 Tax=Daphnia galeata TaxID=27404 RepID=A0A8J2RHA4_9CRUS|nr:unnamed protein product [Daphnia galeata]
MVLVYDSNKSLSVSSQTTSAPEMSEPTAVVTELEQESNAPRTGTMRMPKEKVKWIEYLFEKHGEDLRGFYYEDTLL